MIYIATLQGYCSEDLPPSSAKKNSLKASVVGLCVRLGSEEQSQRLCLIEVRAKGIMIPSSTDEGKCDFRYPVWGTEGRPRYTVQQTTPACRVYMQCGI